MSDFTSLPRDIQDCMKRAGNPLSDDQMMLLSGYLAPVQQENESLRTENNRLKMIDISGHLDVEEVPLCTLCDQPIFRAEPAVIGYVEDAKALMHEDCVEDALG